MRRTSVRLALLVVAALLVPACSSLESSPDAAPSDSGSAVPRGTLQVAAYNFGESQLVANLYAGALNAAGHPAEVKTLTNREIIVPALEKGDVQVVGDYAGTLTEYLNKQVNGPDAPAKASSDLDTTMRALRELAAQEELVVLDPAEARNQNAFAVTKQFAAEHDLKTLSDLAAYSQQNPVTLGGPPECPKRPFCQQGLENTYGLNVKDFRSLDAGGPLTKSALKQGVVDVGLVLTSDGALDQFGLVILEDDKNLQASDNIVPVLNQDASDKAVDDTLNAVQAKLTTQALQDMNYSVDWERQDPEKVAEAWLTLNGLA
ncbi:MAG: ABC transporter substrate-binding protein [Candidatus Nanopelagicales bacterium]